MEDIVLICFINHDLNKHYYILDKRWKGAIT
jgi:hypothetical protein